MTALQPRHDHSGMDMDGSSMAGMKMYFHATIPSTDPLLFQSWVPSSVGPVIGACIGLFVIAVGERFLAALQRGATIHWRRDALRRLANTSSSEYKLPSRADAIPAYNPSTSTAEKPSPGLTDPSAGDEIMPVLSSNPSSTSSTTQRRLAPSTAAQTERQAPPSYLPSTVVRAMTDRARPDRYSIPFIWRNELARGGLMVVTRALGYVLMLVVMTFNVWFIVAVCLGAGVGEAMFGRHGYMH